MAKIIGECILIFLIALMLLTQILIPIFIKDLSLFWLFRGGKRTRTSEVKSLEELDQEAQKSKQSMDQTKQKLSSAEDHLNKIKNTLKN